MCGMRAFATFLDFGGKHGKSGKGKASRRASRKAKARTEAKASFQVTKAANLEKERCRTRARVKVAKLRRVVLSVVK